MINQDKWVNSLPINKIETGITNDRINQDKWKNAIPNIKAKNSVKKYSLMTILFVCGLFLVSVIKNETRNLEKEINNLKASINVVKFNLDQEILDHEVLTSPENISLLAKEYLDNNFATYQKSQIEHLNKENQSLNRSNKLENIKTNKKKLLKSVKLETISRIQKKRDEIERLQALYSEPKAIPGEIKKEVINKIEQKKEELKNIYNSPKDTLTLERIGRWTAVQVAKVFFGMPVIPGK